MSRVLTVARKDVRSAIRSRRYWLLVAVSFGLPALLALLFVDDVSSEAPPGLSPSGAELAVLFLEPIGFWFEGFAAFLAIALGYRSIAGDREAGRLRTVLGLSTTRRDVFLGKLLGRSVVLVLSLAAGVAFLGVVILVRFGPVAGDHLALTGALVTGYALSWLWVSVGVSAAVSTKYRALSLLFGGILSFLFLWREIGVRLLALAFTGDPVIEDLDGLATATEPDWYVYGARLSPRVAYRQLFTRLESTLLDDPPGLAAAGPPGEAAGPVAGGTDPNLFGAAVLVAWGVGALAVGYWRFGRADIAGGAGDGPLDAIAGSLREAAGALRGEGDDEATAGPGDSPGTPDGSPAADAAGQDAGVAVEGADGVARGAGTGAEGADAAADGTGTAAPGDRTATGPERSPPLGRPALSVAKKDFADTVRSKLVWSIGAFFFTTLALGIYFQTQRVDRQVPVFRNLADTMEIVVPFVALVVGYRAVVGERESGSLKLLLGTPVTRRDVALGKYLGRLGTAVAVVASGMALVGGFFLLSFDYLTVEGLLGTAAVVLLYALAWLGIAIGVSSYARSGSMAVATIFGAFVFFTTLWNALVGRALEAVFAGPGFEGPKSVVYSSGPAWFVYLNRLNPLNSYRALNGYVYHFVTDSFEVYPGGTPVVTPNVFGLAILLAWAALPALAGFRLLLRQDLR